MDIDTLLINANKRPGRTNLYIWKNLDHLKAYYAESIDKQTIDRIADRLRNNAYLFKKRDFGLEATMENHLNERCFCNLVEIFLIDQNDNALQQFLNKSV